MSNINTTPANPVTGTRTYPRANAAVRMKRSIYAVNISIYFIDTCEMGGGLLRRVNGIVEVIRIPETTTA